MGTPFRVSRCIELSVLAYLETELAKSWSSVKLVKAFQQAYKNTLPVVCVRLLNTSSRRKEVGSYSLMKFHTVIVDIFATSDGQRLDLADFITDTIASGIPYSTFSNSSGNPAELEIVPSGGNMVVNRFTINRRVELGDDVEVADKFRHVISFTVRR